MAEGHLGLSRSGTEPDGHVHAGHFEIADGAQVRLVRGIAIQDGATSSGEGLLYIEGSGNRAVEGDFNVQNLQAAAGSGALRIAGTLTVSDVFIWDGLNLDDSDVGGDEGIIELPLGSEFRIEGNGQKNVNDITFNIGGTASFSGTANVFADRGATFNVLAGAVFDIRNNELILHGNNGTHVFNNMGTVRKSAGTGVSEIRYIFNNLGTVEVQTGTLILREGGNSTGTFDISASAELAFRGHHFLDLPADSSGITGLGSFRVSANTTSIQGDGTAISIPDMTFAIDGGQLDLVRSIRCSQLIHSSGVLNVPSGQYIRIRDLYELGGADLIGGGQLHLPEESNVNIINTGQLDIEGPTLNISGHVTWTGTTDIAVNGGSVFNLMEGAVFEMKTDERMRYDNRGARPQFNNSGTIIKSAGSGISSIDVPIINDGIVEIVTGTFRAEDAFTQNSGELRIPAGTTLHMLSNECQLDGGLVLGAGNITGNVVNNGATIQPGSSAGTLAISGNYTQGVSGSLSIEVGGTGQGTDHDLLSIGGTASLNGALQLARIDDFVPQSTDVFTFLTAGTVSGAFSAISGTDATGGLFFNPTYAANNVSLVQINGTPSISTSSFTYDQGMFGFQITGVADQSYRVDATQDFIMWDEVETKSLTGTTWDFVDPNPGQLDLRFYRVVFLPQ